MSWPLNMNTDGYKLRGEEFVADTCNEIADRSTGRVEYSFTCPRHKTILTILTDYNGGGSHYWGLYCEQCKSKFHFDTYRFVLEEANE